MLNGESLTKTGFIKKWFEKNSFNLSEAADVFQALEEISDFTVRRRADIILLSVESLSGEFSVINEIVKSFCNDTNISLMALSESGNVINHKDCFEGNLLQIKNQFIKTTPALSNARAA